jgi:hypothetical protein
MSLGESFTYVQSYFTVPQLDSTYCENNPTAAVSAWVGLGGDPTPYALNGALFGQTLEQDGVLILCSTYDSDPPKGKVQPGVPEYISFSETEPSDHGPVFGKLTKPGDLIFASTQHVSGNFHFVVLDINPSLPSWDQVLVDTSRSCNYCVPATAEAIGEQPAWNGAPCDAPHISVSKDPSDPIDCLVQLASFSHIQFEGTGIEDNAGETGDINAVTWDHTQLYSKPPTVNGEQAVLQGEGITYVKFDSNLFKRLGLSADKEGAQYDSFWVEDIRDKGVASAPVFAMTPTTGPPGTTIQLESVSPCPQDSQGVLLGVPGGGGLIAPNSDGSWSASIAVPAATSSGGPPTTPAIGFGAAAPWPFGANDISADCVRVANANDPNVDAPANVALTYRTQQFFVTG